MSFVPKLLYLSASQVLCYLPFPIVLTFFCASTEACPCLRSSSSKGDVDVWTSFKLFFYGPHPCKYGLELLLNFSFCFSLLKSWWKRVPMLLFSGMKRPYLRESLPLLKYSISNREQMQKCAWHSKMLVEMTNKFIYRIKTCAHKRCCCTTMYPETLTYQNGIWSYQRSIWQNCWVKKNQRVFKKIAICTIAYD